MTDQDSRHARRTACSTRHDKNNDHADPWLHLGSGPAEVPAPRRTARPGHRPCPGRRRPPGRPAQRQSPAPAGRSPRAPARLFLRAFRRSPVRPAFGALRPARLLERARLHRDELRHPGRGHEPHHALREAGRRHGHQPHRGGRRAGPADLELPPPDTPGTAPHGRARPGFLGPLRALDRRPGRFAGRGLAGTRPAGRNPRGRLRDLLRLSGALHPTLFGAAGTTGLPGAAAAPGRRDAAAHPGRTCPGADGRAGR